MAGPDPTPAPAPAPTPSGGDSPFGGWLKSTAALYGLVGAAIAALTGLFAPDRLIPEPLQNMKPFVSLIVIMALILAWVFRSDLKRRLKPVVLLTSALLAAVLALNVARVRTVTYTRGEGTLDRQFLVGGTPVHPEDRGISAPDLIKASGDAWDDLAEVWGSSFTTVATAYAVLYPLLIVGVVLSLAASDLVPAKRRK